MAGAVIDLWQADPSGSYDNGSDEMRYRGKVSTDADGVYVFETLLPGRYLNGSVLRPMHIHIKVWVDGQERAYTVRCDAIVSKAGRRYVAEMKGGAEAARIENRATRRQLLEYAIVFGVDGVLLVDAAGGRIHEVAFPLRAGS